MATLHLGSKTPLVVTELLPQDLYVFIEEDTWEEWGEVNEEDRQYSGVHHIIARGKDSAALLADVAWLIENGAPLEPMRGPDHQSRIIACITLDDDWSEALFNVSLGWRGLADHEASQIETEEN